MTTPAHHPDDEQLSAAVDGEDRDAVLAHTGTCAACAARLAAFEAARDAIAAAAVEAPGATVVDSWIGRALGVDDVWPRDELAARRRRRLTTPPPAWLLGAAAAIAALAGVAGLHRAGGGGDDRAALGSATAEKDSGTGFSTGASDEAADAGSSVAATASVVDPEVVVADLGDQADADALTARLGAVAPAAGLSAQRQAAPSAPGAAGDASPPVTTAVPDRARCADAGRRRVGGAGSLESTAVLRWRGQDAEVLVFGTPGATSRRALVLRRPSCEVLADAPF